MKSLIAWLRRPLFDVYVEDKRVFSIYRHHTVAVLAVVAALLVGFTGGLFTGHYAWKPSQQQVQKACPPEKAQLGCDVKLYAAHNHATVKDPSGPHFPDVSSWQGHPNWVAAKGSISGAIVKAYEYSPDPDLAYNANELTRLHIRWGAYLFVRNCFEGPAFAQTVRPWAAHIAVLVLDMEVPSASGCAPRLYVDVHHALPNLRVVIYSAPGTWPGGSSAGLDAWVAAYGPSHPPCLFTCRVGVSTGQTILAWQLTDGQYGFRTYVPGIGYGDVSLDYGIFQTAPAPKPKPRPRPRPLTRVQVFKRCFDRGYDVHWDRRHHRTVPPTSLNFKTPGCQPGYNAGYDAVR